MYKCEVCDYVADYQSFVHDYIFDYELDDEVAILVCPKCGNSDEIKIVEVEGDINGTSAA